MDMTQNQSSEKNSRLPVEEASKEDLVKQVKRQLGLLQKAKARCDDLNRKCQEKDKINEDLVSKCRLLEDAQKETEGLRQAYLSLQSSQEMQFDSFQVLESQLASSNEDVVKWRRKYQECLERLECTESKMAAYTQGTECLQGEFRRLENENKVYQARIEELLQTKRQLEEEKVALQQHVTGLEQEKQALDSEASLEISQGHLKQKVEELLLQCNVMKQERDTANSSNEAVSQQLESANAEISSLQLQLSALLEERSSLENQRDMKMNECNLLQEEKHGLENQVSDLYQSNEAKEKEFAKILDENSSLEKSLTEAVNENTQLQVIINDLREKLGLTEAENQRLSHELEVAVESSKEAQSLRHAVQELERKFESHAKERDKLARELDIAISQKAESEKYIENLKASLANSESCVTSDQLSQEFKEQELQQLTPDENLLQVLELEKKELLSYIAALEESARAWQAEKPHLEEQLAKVKEGDEALLESLNISVAKVSLLEKQLQSSLHQKQDIVDELNQVKDLQRFLEDEAKELHRECEKFKTQTGRLEADLENDRLHIQKLEHELEDAEMRDQQSLREVEVLRCHLREMAVFALKSQETLDKCPVHDAESRISLLLKEFHRVCQLILEVAERNLVDVHIEGLLPGVGATLVLSDSCEYSSLSCEANENDREEPVSAERIEAFKRELENLQEQLQASSNSVELLQFEKQAIEEELVLEKAKKEAFNRDLIESKELLSLAERKAENVAAEGVAKIFELEGKLEESKKELVMKEEELTKAQTELFGINEKHTELSRKYDLLSEKISCATNIEEMESTMAEQKLKLKALEHELKMSVEHSTVLEADLQASQNQLYEIQSKYENLNSENAVQSSNLTSHDKKIVQLQKEVESLKQMNAALASQVAEVTADLSSKNCQLSEGKQQYTELQAEVDSLQKLRLDLVEECSKLKYSLESRITEIDKLTASLQASDTAKACLQEAFEQELSALKSELLTKTNLLQEVHGRLDDQLERTEHAESLLSNMEETLNTCKCELENKESELTGMADELIRAKDCLTQQQSEYSSLCAILNSNCSENSFLESDSLCDWLAARRKLRSLILRLVSIVNEIQLGDSSDSSLNSALEEAQSVYATLSAKTESDIVLGDDPCLLKKVIASTTFSETVVELKTLAGLQQLLTSLASCRGTSSGDASLIVAEDAEKESEQVAALQSSLKEKDERLAKFKALVVKLKRELAEKGKQLNTMEKELNVVKLEYDKNLQTSKQTMQNFQSLQSEYDKLQDQNEAKRLLCKELESKVTSVVNDLASAQMEAASISAERDKLKQTNDVMNAELKAWEQCKTDMETKLKSLESELSMAKGQEEKLQASLKTLEDQVLEANKQLVVEKEKHANTALHLEKVQKESKMHTLLNLEIADYERTVAELNSSLKDKNEELDGVRKEVHLHQTKIANLMEHIDFLETQKNSDDEQILAFKETIAGLKEGLSQSRKHEEELVRAEVRLESEIKAAQLREEDAKLNLAELSRKCQGLESNLHSSRDTYQRATRTLESKIASLKEQLATVQGQLESTKEEFDNYKVRVHTVLKQQKKSSCPQGDASSSSAESDSQDKLHSVVEQLRARIKDLMDQVEVGRSEVEASQEEYDRLAQRHQLVAAELEVREKEWKHRLEDALKLNTMEMSIELDKQLQQQYEALSSKFQRKLLDQEKEHKSAMESQQEAFDELKREVSELQQKLPRHASPQEEAPPFDITTVERQDGEGSESVSPGPVIPLKPLPWELVPTGGFKPLEQLLHGDDDQAAEDPEILYSRINEVQKKVDHLSELLNESESSNLRMTEQIRVLKEEIRRLERNQEREKHAQNLEYLKNIIMKFATLQGGSEKERLVPVLTTMLKLSPEEHKELLNVVSGESQQDSAASSGWGGYLQLPRLPGFLG